MGAGRPREFDEEAVLEAAMQLFWCRGFEATSKRDLMDATGVASQSLYNAFGDKRALYLAAVRHYASTRLAALERELEAPGSPLGNVRAALRSLRKVPSDCERQQGCLLCNTLAELGRNDVELAALVLQQMKRSHKVYTRTLLRAREAGELASGADVEAIAATIVSATNGLSLLRRAGAPKRLQEQSIDGVLVLLDACEAA